MKDIELMFPLLIDILIEKISKNTEILNYVTFCSQEPIQCFVFRALIPIFVYPDWRVVVLLSTTTTRASLFLEFSWTCFHWPRPPFMEADWRTCGTSRHTTRSLRSSSGRYIYLISIYKYSNRHILYIFPSGTYKHRIGNVACMWGTVWGTESLIILWAGYMTRLFYHDTHSAEIDNSSAIVNIKSPDIMNYTTDCLNCIFNWR